MLDELRAVRVLLLLLLLPVVCCELIVKQFQMLRLWSVAETE